MNRADLVQEMHDKYTSLGDPPSGVTDPPLVAPFYVWLTVPPQHFRFAAKATLEEAQSLRLVLARALARIVASEVDIDLTRRLDQMEQVITRLGKASVKMEYATTRLTKDLKRISTDTRQINGLRTR